MSIMKRNGGNYDPQPPKGGYLNLTKKKAMQCEKVTYETRAMANGACHGMGKRNKNVYSYQCPTCGLWHIATHAKRKMQPHKKAKNWKRPI